MFKDAYRNRTVLVTGHTGFKGSWLTLWLLRLGARVVGYSLPPPTEPSLFDRAGLAAEIEHHLADIRDVPALERAVRDAEPDFVFHLAAQPLVLDSYGTPAETFNINVMGSINVMEAVRLAGRPAAVVMVTTDKVYQNREWPFGYRETDPLGGHDPYSASKAAMEVAIASWRNSFFPPAGAAEHGIRLASARAGNVVGGGDWSDNRIVPDLARALAAGRPAGLRNPGALRPWQHVLEPLAGYLQLGASLAGEGGGAYADAWNFGPAPTDVRTVGDLAEAMARAWGTAGWVDASDAGAQHEAGILKLGIDKAVGGLGWRPVWDFDALVARTAWWYKAVLDDAHAARAATEADLDAYIHDAVRLGIDWSGDAPGSGRGQHQ